jgi:hypothetical protein
MSATRPKAINCRFKAYAGDTRAPKYREFECFILKIVKWKVVADFYCPMVGLMLRVIVRLK